MRLLPFLLLAAIYVPLAQPASAAWVIDSQPDGVSRTPQCLLVLEDKLLVGGSFARAGSQDAPGLASWDGTHWAAESEAATGDIESLLQFQGKTYAVGRLQNDRGLLELTPSGWESKDVVLNNPFDAIVYNDELVIAAFNTELNDGQFLGKIVAWDGVSWKSIAYNLPENARVHYLGVHEDRLYASVHTPDSETEQDYYVFRLSGEVWSQVGDSFDQNALAFASYNGTLFIGGFFRSNGAQPLLSVAKLDGDSWTSVGQGFEFPDHRPNVYAMTVWNNRLVIGGSFREIAGLSAYSVAAWDGASWTSLGTETSQSVPGTGSTVHSLTTYEGDLYAAGSFDYAGGVEVSHVARFDGKRWYRVGRDYEPPDHVNAIIEFQGRKLAGGYFGNIGNTPVTGLAELRDGRWHPHEAAIADPSITNFNVLSLSEYEGHLIAGGRFKAWENNIPTVLMRLTGSTWEVIPFFETADIPGAVFGTTFVCDAVEYQGKLIVGGDFQSEDPKFRGVAAWDGKEWQALGEGVNARVWDLHVHNGLLYVGGNFQKAGGLDANFIASWDGNTWKSLKWGTGGTVGAMLSLGDDLIVGGSFFTTSGLQTNSIARWDGEEWHPIGPGFPRVGNPETVSALALYQGRILAGSRFIQEYSPSGISFWNGAYWVPIGEGFYGAVQALHVDQDRVTVGGLLRLRDDFDWPEFGTLLWRGDLPVGSHPVENLQVISKPEGIELTWDLNRADGILGYSLDRRTGVSDWVPIQPLISPVVGENRFFDDTLDAKYIGSEVTYRLRAILNGGTFAELEGLGSTQFLPDSPSAPRLNAPYPNPVSLGSPVTIAFSLMEANPTEVRVFDANGRAVKSIASEIMGPGSVAIAWDGTDDWGQPVASGVYFVHLTSGDFRGSRRLVLVP